MVEAMKVEVQTMVYEMMEDVVEISEKEALDVIRNSREDSMYTMSLNEALMLIAAQKLEDKYMNEYDDLEVDYVRILE